MRRRLLFVTALMITLVAAATTTNRQAEGAFQGLNAAPSFAAAKSYAAGPDPVAAANHAAQPQNRFHHAYSPAETGGTDIYTMSADGSGQANLTNDPNSNDGFPAWSNDGAKIAWTQIANSTSDAEIFSMDADGTDRRDLSNDPATADFDPDWSPNGTLIVWARASVRATRHLGDALGRNEPDAADVRWVVRRNPSWSPDGTKIAFARSIGGPDDIFVMNADGSGVTNLTNVPTPRTTARHRHPTARGSRSLVAKRSSPWTPMAPTS